MKCLACSIAVLVLAGLSLTMGQTRAFVAEGVQPYEVTRVEWMAVRLASTINVTDPDFVIRFSPHPQTPNTLLIDVLYAHRVDRDAMEDALKFAIECCQSWKQNHEWEWLRIEVRRTSLSTLPTR